MFVSMLLESLTSRRLGEFICNFHEYSIASRLIDVFQPPLLYLGGWFEQTAL